MQITNKKRDIIIGDVHGCLEELKLLIGKIRLGPNDRIFFIGDIIDRGYDSIGTIKYIKYLSTLHTVVLIIGNHEEKFLRYIEKKNDLNNDIFNDYIKKLTSDDISFLKNAYYNYFIADQNIMLIHAGFLKKIKLVKGVNNKYINRSHKEYSLLTMVRCIDLNDNFIEMSKSDENSTFWAEKYNGDVGRIVFGHNYYLQDSPKIYNHAIGIDNGCVYGGWLTALIFDEECNSSSISIKSEV